ncbi:TPA: TNT domain-containing protein [Clostridium botulinum]|nr:TNT domain-containing protein [Clostridium botulinum]
MKRNIKINYGKIEEIIYNISKYESALEDMESSLKSIHQEIRNSTGESINALLENYEVLTRNIDICKEELNDLRKILSDYINEMSRYAQAIDRGSLIRVDRNDVWWNIKSMEGIINQITDEQMKWGYNYSGSWSSDKDVIEREEYNARQIESINHIVEKYVNILNQKIQEIYAIHNSKVIPFENTDDAFRDRAWNMYCKCTGFGDWVGDFFGFLDKSFNNIIDGVLKGLTDLVVGLAQLAIGAVQYVGSCAVVVLCEPFGGAPDWIKDKMDSGNELILSILKDPALIIEGIAQDASDAVDEKGICYSVGYLGGTFFGTKGLDKITKGVKGLISGGKAATINSLDDIARYGLNSLDDIIEKAGIQSVDDLARIGVISAEDLSKLGLNSVDDLAKLGINNIDELSKLGISAEDLSKAGIKGAADGVNLWRESTCNNNELYNYLFKNVNADVASKFLKDGKWPDGIQIPKNSSVLNPNGSINWSKAAEGGYTLNIDGTAIKEEFTPEMVEIIDRYGNANGRYTSPVINGESYAYTERSLPYVEDLSNYHQYEVVGDFTKIKEYVDKCTDIKLKTEIETTVRKYYKGDYSRLVSYKGNAAAVEGWGKGGAIQYEFSLTVEQLEGLGLLKEIK